MAYTKAYNKKKKMFLGGAMAVGQLGMDVAATIKARQDAKNAKRAASQSALRSEFNTDKNLLDTYNSKGSDVNIFKKGGSKKLKIAKTKGKSGLAKVPNSKDIYKVIGPKHEQGGVDLTNNVEVEKDEYVKMENGGIKVLSNDDSFNTIPADSFENKKGTKSTTAAFNEAFNNQELEKSKGMVKPSEVGKYETGAFIPKSRIQTIGSSNPNNYLRPELETDKLNKFKLNNSRNASIAENTKSGNFNNTLTAATPYLDNVGNAIMTLAKPKAIKPIYDKAVSLNTDVNVNPQLANIKRTASNVGRSVRGNFANPISSQALQSKANTDALYQTNEMLGKEQEIERNLENQELAMNQQIDSRNKGLAMNYRQRVANRSQQQLGELSQNMANVQDDITRKQNIDKMTSYQDKQLAIELSTDVEGKNAPKVLMGHFDSVLQDPSFDIETSGYSERTKRALRDRAITLNLNK